MFNQTSKNPTSPIADQAAQSADNAIQSTKRVSNELLDGLTESVQNARHQAAPILNQASEQVSSLVQRGMDSVRDTSHHMQESAQRASQSTVKFIKDEPVKSMLIAAATGAALMALVGLMSRSHARS